MGREGNHRCCFISSKPFVMAGLDSVPGGLAGDLTPPCVPEELGNMRFYDAMPAKTWLVNATAYGHGDVINEFYYEGLVVSSE